MLVIELASSFYKMKRLFIILTLIVANAHGQNITLDDQTRGTLKVSSRLGVNTNGATAGQVLTYNGSAVVWGAGGGGGAFPSAGVSNGVMNVDWLSLAGVGGHTWTFSTNATKIPTGNIGSGFAVLAEPNTFTDENVFPNVSINTKLTFPSSTSGIIISNAGANPFFLVDPSSSTFSVRETNGDIIMLWANDGNGVYLFDDAGVGSVESGSRRLRSGASTRVHWGNRELDGGDWAYVQGFGNTKFTVETNFYVLGTDVGMTNASLYVGSVESPGDITGNTLNGLNPSTILTNLVDVSGLSFAGTGTHTFTPALDFTLIVTNNGTPTFNNILGGGSPMNFKPNDTDAQLILGDTGAITVGFDSSSAYTLPGQTLLTPNTLTVNSGQVTFPSSATGTVSNGVGGIYSLGLGNYSNVITRGDAILQTSSNQFQISINGGAGTLITRASFTRSKSTMSTASPVVNAIYTNSNQQLNVNASLSISANSQAALWTVDGSVTNFLSTIRNNANATTNYVSGFIQPNALYMVTNSAGTASVISGRWNETRF